MMLRHRMAFAMMAVVYCAWAEATFRHHFVGSPDLGMRFLLYSPAMACILTIAGLWLESGWVHKHDLPAGYPPYFLPLPIRVLEVAGIAFLGWRVFWLWFGWDGMLLFPAMLLLILTIWRQKPTPKQALAAEIMGRPMWGFPRVTRWTREYHERPQPEMRPVGPQIGGRKP